MTTELIIRQRCPYCGDSQKNASKTHMVIYLNSGNFHCYRCNTHGYLTLTELLSLTLNNVIPLAHGKRELVLGELPKDLTLIQGMGPLNRYSAVQARYALHRDTLKGPIEIFESRDRKGAVTGYQLRASWDKICRSMGILTLGYSPANLLNVDYIRLVEGPYDVLDVNDACCWGMPRLTNLEQLKYIPLVLCPDGDIWTEKKKALRWFKPFLTSGQYLIEYVEVLPFDKDPDEVPINERTRVTWNQVKQLFHSSEQRRMVYGAGIGRLPSFNLQSSQGWRSPRGR